MEARGQHAQGQLRAAAGERKLLQAERYRSGIELMAGHSLFDPIMAPCCFFFVKASPKGNVPQSHHGLV